ncbi:GntR family transcriptional regulator [Gordonia polyisoprenivorans]|uniref:GntR family transcriptional regulator n=1 Tax=Gordonia polyisoprenivorans TaxID=84595 RepID=UPI00037610A4|nr:GntR family transcriptional regulator [Gordonia polyisoprenivorans]UZF57839.1 GntR family transcriptional regulator [Gordonia polyisoprenivorans]WCB38845.1 GntR family transcriptional regulator [Gordonia polyisoprenivorans]
MWSEAEVAVSPRYQEIYEALRHQIVDGTYQPGDELPPETVLMDQWQVSRGPIRQALYKLRTEGFIYTTRGRPARVRRPHSPTQTLSSFTPFSQWALTTGREPGNHTISVSRTRVTAEIAEALQIGVDDFLIEVVRLRTLDGIPALLERSRFTTDVGASLFDFDPDKGSITDHLVDEGVQFASMRHELDAVAADATDAEALQIDSGAPLLRERRTSYDPQGRPFEYSDDRYRPDQVTFSIMNTMTGDERG